MTLALTSNLGMSADTQQSREKDPAAVALGCKAGLKRGQARAVKMTLNSAEKVRAKQYYPDGKSKASSRA